MTKISCQNVIRPSDETMETDDANYCSGDDAGPETEEEERSTSKPKG